MSARHKCAATGCAKQVPTEYLMCLRHWYQVPRPLRDLVHQAFAAWRQGAETSLGSLVLVNKLRAAQRQAVEAVERAEV